MGQRWRGSSCVWHAAAASASNTKCTQYQKESQARNKQPRKEHVEKWTKNSGHRRIAAEGIRHQGVTIISFRRLLLFMVPDQLLGEVQATVTEVNSARHTEERNNRQTVGTWRTPQDEQGKVSVATWRLAKGRCRILAQIQNKN